MLFLVGLAKLKHANRANATTVMILVALILITWRGGSEEGVNGMQVDVRTEQDAQGKICERNRLRLFEWHQSVVASWAENL